MSNSNTITNPPLKSGWVLVGTILRGLGLALLLTVAITGNAWAAWLSMPAWFLIWLTSVAQRHGFKKNLANLPWLGPPFPEASADAGFSGVTVISPGRNEEMGIEAAARSLAALNYPRLEIILVNDHSTDSTGAILDRLAIEFPQLHVIHDPPVQEGWLGKANAVWYAIHQANPENKWLVLTDADIVFHPETLRAAVAHADNEGLDFLTCIPRLVNQGLAEEFVTASGGWPATILYADRKRMNEPDFKPIGVGAFILISRAAYLACGGHSAFAGQQPEDTLLAVAIKKWGGKMDVAWTSDMIRVRQYCGYKQVRRAAVVKSRVNTDDSLVSLLTMMMYSSLMFLLPMPVGLAALFHLLVRGQFSWGLTIFAVSAFLCYFEHSRTIRESRAIVEMRSFVPWVHPLAGVMRIWFNIVAIGQVLFGRKMDWRGRTFVNVRTERNGAGVSTT